MIKKKSINFLFFSLISFMFLISFASAATLTVQKDDCEGASDCYNTIQDAIDAASSGDTINVGAGSYVTTGQVVINKDLTIIGDESKPTISPDNDLPKTNNVAGAWFLITSGVEFNLENFVLDGNGFSVYQGIRSHGNSNIENIDFLNIKDNTSPYVGFAVANFGGTIPVGAGSDTHSSGGGASTLTVTDSTFSQIGRIGILVKGTESTANIIDNVYTGKGEGNFLDYAFEAGAGGNIIAINNIISNNKGIASDGSTSAGILVTDYYGIGTKSNLTYNTITDSTTAIAVGYDDEDESIVIANYNTLTGNSYGIESTNPLVNAQNNYWGTIGKSEIESLISGNVEFSPWYDETFTTRYFAVDEEGVAEYNEEGVGGVTINTTGESTAISIEIESLTDEDVENEESVFGLSSIGKFLRIESNVPDEDIEEVEIRVYYNEGEVINESNLRLYYYDSDIEEWVPASIEEGNYGVNTDEDYVWAITDHLSEYGIFADEEGPNISNIYINPNIPNLLSTLITVYATITDPNGVANYPELRWRLIKDGITYPNTGYYSAPQMNPIGDSVYRTTFEVADPEDDMSIEYRIAAEDNLGNGNAFPGQYGALFTYDGSAPTTSDSASPDWTKDDVVVTLTCDDTISGCNKTYYSYDGSYPINLYDNTSFTLSGTGEYQLRYYSIDNAGNVEDESEVEGTLVRIDKIVPTITDDYSNDSVWVNIDQMITLTPEDLGGSGIYEVRYCEGESCDPLTEGTVLDSSYELTFDDSQDTIIRYQAGDNAGNPSEIGEFNIKLDKITPETTDNAPTGWQNSAFDITLTEATSDSLSPITTYYKVWEVDETEPETYEIGTTIPVTKNGEYNIKYYSEDEAGNIETAQSVVAQLDMAAPVVSISPLEVQMFWTKNSTELSVTCGDGDLSGCNASSYVVKEFSEETDCSTVDYSGASSTLTMTEHGYVCARATDNAGNTAYSSLTEILIDTVAPLAKITSPSNNANLTGDTMIIVNANDSLSGIDTVTFELKNSEDEVVKSGSLTYNNVTKRYNAMLSNVLEDLPTGIYTLEVTAEDDVGKIETDSITLNAVEYVLPIITSVISNAPYGQNSTVEFNIDLTIRNGTAVRMKMSDLTDGTSSYTPEQLNARLVYDGVEYPVRNDYTGDKIILPSTPAGASGTAVFKMDILSYMAPGSYKATYQFEITQE